MQTFKIEYHPGERYAWVIRTLDGAFISKHSSASMAAGMLVILTNAER